MYSNPSVSQKMSYWQSFTYNLNNFKDVFSGSHYQSLLLEQVIIDNVACSHKYFSNPRDIALGLLMDGFQVFCQVHGGSTTCWPIIAINFNLPPSEQIHLSNIIPIVVVPGPKAPKDINSFFCPLINECKMLAKGVVRGSLWPEAVQVEHWDRPYIGDQPASKRSLSLLSQRPKWLYRD